MILIALTGAIGHGKSTFAEALHIHVPDMLHLETNMPIIEIAERLHHWGNDTPDSHDIKAINHWLSSLPAIIDNTIHRSCTQDELLVTKEAIEQSPAEYEKLLAYLRLMEDQPALRQELITSHNKDTFRPLLQWLGGYLVDRLDPLVWTAEVIERAREYADNGGRLAVIGGVRYPAEAEAIRGSEGKVVLVVRPGMDQRDETDPTERERSLIEPDCTVLNNGAVLDLVDIAERFIADANAGALQASYSATQLAQ